MKMPAASTIRDQRSDEKPAGAGIEESAAYPSAQVRGTAAPHSITAARSSMSSGEANAFGTSGTTGKSCPTTPEGVGQEIGQSVPLLSRTLSRRRTLAANALTLF